MASSTTIRVSLEAVKGLDFLVSKLQEKYPERVLSTHVLSAVIGVCTDTLRGDPTRVPGEGVVSWLLGELEARHQKEGEKRSLAFKERGLALSARLKEAHQILREREVPPSQVPHPAPGVKVPPISRVRK